MTVTKSVTTITLVGANAPEVDVVVVMRVERSEPMVELVWLISSDAEVVSTVELVVAVLGIELDSGEVKLVAIVEGEGGVDDRSVVVGRPSAPLADTEVVDSAGVADTKELEDGDAAPALSW